MSYNSAFNNSEEALEYLLEEAALNGADRQSRYPDHKFLGFFCSYFPEELIIAAGLNPLRLFPDSENANPVELPPYCCSLARGTLEMEIQQKWGDLAGIGFAHTCDAMQCLSGIWASCSQNKTFDIVPPVMLKAPGAASYFYAELNNLLSMLSALIQQPITKDDLHAAIELCGLIRKLVFELDELRPNLPSPLVSAILRAGQVMPRELYAQALEKSLPAIRERVSDSGKRVRVLITGAVLEKDSLFEMIEELGGRVAADDTCTGYRHFSGTTTHESEDPLIDIIKRYTEMPPCPCKNIRLNERPANLTTLAKQRQADAALIVIRKYCEPHAWDAVALRDEFQKTGIRTQILELEGAAASGQERTRLQAFLENLLEGTKI
ncbi:Benzoyl-CoA reductase/2-hydroxyglutaryl-CoA dehydratase subunit, BcrC/BadD/HgdB [Desulfosporosinus orientis DSM 765]|uniref:Benzoyl-CoA reductase/2-hydroxyglutaryl-CoA dehydratase subunit, BcrC/BadD/HgdB n=1 Tax=Desulfosporosinus orientis (strain ATCC 19365 / DSM 765 / NCIMB 8382 / VKM B-1628 / Singapore I) TaxID=768706 RepID=G7W5Z0_DESOD|nr:2-hydroxyacyl-CoA dehydratase family protein [Desulfosporosinus orientis]AET67366.1 Benzoyl-CoA reductase/2-hydroxyglutaryl-CoA dehydratase subunit, BcrC/BadD/HgdB [Desulfosporosinus orientis DSM 765]